MPKLLALAEKHVLPLDAWLEELALKDRQTPVLHEEPPLLALPLILHGIHIQMSWISRYGNRRLNMDRSLLWS